MKARQLKNYREWQYVFDMFLDTGEFYYTSHAFDTREDAKAGWKNGRFGQIMYRVGK